MIIGTPISNSMSEMYTLMRYLQADKLSEMGIHSFDQWASVFGETTTSMELSPEGNGKYQMKTRFSKFQNLPELMNAFKECADIKTADSLNLDRPDFEMHNVNVPATAIQLEMIKDLGERARDIRAGTVQPTEDNMCKLTVDGRKIGLDQRCIDPSLPDDPNSKVNVCINNVFDIWQRTADKRSTQLIFSDLATPQAALNENAYILYRPAERGGYKGIYSGKLAEKDTAEKISEKLGSKPPKDYTYGSISEGDIIMLRKVDYTSETAHNTAFEMRDGKLTQISTEKWSEIKHSPEEFFRSERKFCVYDDIKKKLVDKGIPESEIAFIHDFDKAEDKQKLFDKMNKGDVRVLIGSTLKCGAGMNAQQRMIALHDLDAPMRPSDVDHLKRNIFRLINRALNPAHKFVINLDFLGFLAVIHVSLVNNNFLNKSIQNRRVQLGDKAEILDKLNKAVHIFNSRLAIAYLFFKLGNLIFKSNLLGFVFCGKLFVVSLRNVTADLVLVQTGKQTVKLREPLFSLAEFFFRIFAVVGCVYVQIGNNVGDHFLVIFQSAFRTVLNIRKNSFVKTSCLYPMLCAVGLPVEPVVIALIAHHINNVGSWTSPVSAGFCKRMVAFGAPQ